MKNTFKLLMPEEELPPELKKRVMDRIHSIDMMLNMAELFTVNYAKTIGNQFSADTNEKKKNKRK